MTRRNGVIKALATVAAAFAGTRVTVAQETAATISEAPGFLVSQAWQPKPSRMTLSLDYTLGIEISFRGETVSLTPAEIMAALREK